jgi:hypothetical protein
VRKRVVNSEEGTPLEAGYNEARAVLGLAKRKRGEARNIRIRETPRVVAVVRIHLCPGRHGKPLSHLLCSARWRCSKEAIDASKLMRL